MEARADALEAENEALRALLGARDREILALRQELVRVRASPGLRADAGGVPSPRPPRPRRSAPAAAAFPPPAAATCQRARARHPAPPPPRAGAASARRCHPQVLPACLTQALHPLPNGARKRRACACTPWPHVTNVAQLGRPL